MSVFDKAQRNPELQSQYGVPARLRTLVPNVIRNYATGDFGDGSIQIDFPAMPESIDLAREATYTSTPFPNIPDGYHQYMHTEPMSIPFRFKLHAADPYCGKSGPVQLINMAAKLHALTLPIVKDSYDVVNYTQWEKEAKEAEKEKSKGDDDSLNDSVNMQEANPSLQVISSPNDSLGAYYFPPVCLLNIMLYGDVNATGDSAPAGINCVGFVRSVRVSLKGPWITNKAHSATNLPSSAEFEFVFVHDPNYSNKENLVINRASLGAKQIYNRFYNTTGISTVMPVGLNAPFAK